jgi:hypothetical protein
MTLQQLRQVKESLEECGPDSDDFSWGPTYEFAIRRRQEALNILNKEIAAMEQFQSQLPNRSIK